MPRGGAGGAAGIGREADRARRSSGLGAATASGGQQGDDGHWSIARTDEMGGDVSMPPPAPSVYLAIGVWSLLASGSVFG